MEKKPDLKAKVVIVGAGIAGLSASIILQKHQIPHVILEGTNFLGGRTSNANQFFGEWYDQGGSYLHEGKINPLVEISESLGLKVRKDTSDRFSIAKTHFYMNSSYISRKMRSDIIATHNKFKLKLNSDLENAADKPLSYFLDNKNKYYPILTHLLTGLNAIEPNLVSAKDFNSVNEEDDFVIESGLCHMIKRWSLDTKVMLNETVENITWPNEKIIVKTKKNIYEADKVLLTVSQGVLKNKILSFIPALPSSKTDAINGLGMGLLNKIGLLFEDKTFSVKDEGWYVSFVTNKKGQVLDVSSFELRTKPKNHTIFFLGGEKAKDLERNPTQNLKNIEKVVLRIFGKETQNRILDKTYSTWAQNGFSLGSYSYAIPGHKKARQILGRPLSNKLFFAGEATSEHHYGTCHGAYFSGITAAEAIIASF